MFKKLREGNSLVVLWLRRELPVSPVVKTLCFHCREHGPISGRRTKIPLVAKKIFLIEQKFKKK